MNADKLAGLLRRAIPYLREAGEQYLDDGSNEPLELARDADEAIAEYDAQPAQAAQPVGVPVDLAMVPRVPTSAMLDRAVALALNVTIHGAGGWSNYMCDVWNCMLAAAPQPPAQPSADAEDAARYRWLRPRLLTADFEYGDDSETVLVFLIPTTMAVSANLDKSIDAARAAEGDGK